MTAELRDLPAPAKLNLFLHVTGRRDDGYHLLETVFELIDLADAIDLVRREDGRIERLDPLPGVAPEADLTVRAARLLAAESGCRLGVAIGLRKRIPMGGGLGGGSSDAATVLLGLNRLWGLHWAPDRLARLGVRLGADVPVFLFGRTAYATGIGEELQALSLPPRTYVVMAPPVAVPTAVVFGAPELTRNTKPLKIDGLSRGRKVFDGKNDLQPVVTARYPAVAAALEALGQAAAASGVAPGLARMSGSGACVFVPVDGEEQAQRVVHEVSRLHRPSRDGESPATVAEPRPTLWITRSLPRHPLRD
jgi:4-diphosphocytidyl-2-C-methyl-D-erythritol kinase